MTSTVLVDIKTFQRGFSSASESLDRVEREARDHFKSIATFSKQPVLNELYAVYKECCTQDWDIHGAHPIQLETFLNALEFIEALPLWCEFPSVGAEPDGHMTLGWYRAANWLLSVSISPEGMLYYAALLADEDPRGSCPFDSHVPETILYWIRRVCVP